MLDQQDHAGSERVGRRLRAAHEQVGHHLRVQLVVVERAAPLGNLAVDERAEQRVLRLPAQLLEHRLEVVLRLDLGEHRLLGLLVGLHQPHPLDPLVRPPLDPRQVLVRDTHLTADHVERERHGVLRDPLAAAVAEEVLDELVGDVLDVGVDLLDRGRAEGVVEHAPHLHVVRLVPRVEARSRRPALLLVELREPLGALCDRVVRLHGLAGVVGAVPDAVRVALGVEQDRADVLVARDEVHPGERVLPDGRLVPQLLVGGVRAVVRLGIEEVDLARRS